MQRIRLLTFSIVLACGICPLVAEAPSATLTITLSGTLGPTLRGSDPLNANGKPGTIRIMVSESLSPTKTTSNSATYTLPGGSVFVDVAGIAFTSSQPGSMTVQFTSTADILKVISGGPLGAQVLGTAYLAKGSWPRSVFQHPTAFSPSPQNLTPAAVAGGPGSTMGYKFLGSNTTLGLTGTASN